jgi:hypothetical protein
MGRRLQPELSTIHTARAVSVDEACGYHRLEVLLEQRRVAQALGTPQSKLLLTNYVASRGAQGATNSREADDPTSGCGIAQFTDGKADGEALHKTCFSRSRLHPLRIGRKSH